MATCVTYQGIESGTCRFTPEGGSAAILNLVTAISISPSVVVSSIKGDADIYPRCQYVSAGATSGSLTSIDIEAVDAAITPGVAGTLTWQSKDKVSGGTVTYTIQDCTFSDNSTSFATETSTADSLTFTAGSASNDGVTNPAARVFT